MILPRLGRIAASVTTPAAHPPLDLPWETPAPITDQAGAPDLAASLLATSAHHPTTTSAIAMARTGSGAPLAAAAVWRGHTPQAHSCTYFWREASTSNHGWNVFVIA